MVEELLDVFDGQQMFTIHRYDDGVPDLGYENLWFVLDLHVRGSEDLGVDPFRCASEDIHPGCPDRQP